MKLNQLFVPSVIVIAAVSLLIASSVGAAEKNANATGTPGKTVAKEGKKDKMSIYDFKAKALDGKEISLNQYKGDVVLIVNTASECGFTPQYQGLEELHKKYSSKGLRVLGFPCNQFGGQEPGDSAKIANFCQKNFGVDFQMFEKVDVNGKDAHPLYKYLTGEAPGMLGSEGIKWNFTKFLVDRDGKVVKRFAPTVKPEDLSGDIEKLL